MFEDFRKQAQDADFPEDNPQEQAEALADPGGRFLGMTPVQRFIISILLLVMTILLGTLLLVVNSKIELPFF